MKILGICVLPMLLLTGCGLVQKQAPGGLIYTRVLDGIEAPIVNNFAPCVDIRVSDGQQVRCLGLGQRTTIRSNRQLLGPNEIVIDIVARTESGAYLGVDSETYHFRRGRRELYRTWVIDKTNPPREIRTGR
jgi:hypothetical protein